MILEWQLLISYLHFIGLELLNARIFHRIELEVLTSFSVRNFMSLKSDLINLQEFERSLSWRNIGP